jgi:rubrerythrin
MKTALVNTVASFFDTRFLSRLVANPRGRAFLLSFMADAEEADEAGVFDALLERVDDPKLHQLVKKHVDDEARHAELLRARVRAVGVEAPVVPRELSIVQRIDTMLGGLGASFVAKERSIMDAYVLLEVVEERAVEQFPKIAAALEPVDPESAATVRSIWEDERRHVLYARAINKRYAPDADTLARALEKVHAVEQRAFDENGAAFLRHALDANLLELPFAERVLWRAMSLAA